MKKLRSLARVVVNAEQDSLQNLARNATADSTVANGDSVENRVADIVMGSTQSIVMIGMGRIEGGAPRFCAGHEPEVALRCIG
ncbi:MAG TPA: hypothetical protein VKP02_09625 [Gemmatimonadaceae bacterium]|nr:hypothetical protein [Gemmatimonadaceae bacterium]